MSVHNEEEKRAALRDLVKEAYWESINYYPNGNKFAGAPAFDPAGFQKYHMETLLTALETTDALHVLYDILEEQEWT